MPTMRGRYPLSILSSVAFSTFALAAVPAEPVITAAPVLPRQNNDRFIGFVSFSGSWYSETCNVGLTWYQSGSYGQCCPATLASCYAPTACVSGSLIYPYSDKSSTTTIACTNNYANKAFSVCNTAFIFENMQDSSPKTDIVCGESSVNWSYYRSIPASATAISSAAPSNANQATSNPQPSGGSSKAWIAGAVVGPILGLALIGALVWFILRKRQRTTQQAGGTAIAPSDPNAPPAGVGGYTDAKPQFPPTQQPYDPYVQQNQQGAYAAQHGMQHQYSDAPTTPAPGYASNPTSPGLPSQHGSEYYGGDAKSGYAGVPANGAAELGGGEASVANSNVQSQSMHQTAELGGGEVNSTAAGVGAPQGQGQGQGIFGASELPAGGKTT